MTISITRQRSATRSITSKYIAKNPRASNSPPSSPSSFYFSSVKQQSLVKVQSAWFSFLIYLLSISIPFSICPNGIRSAQIRFVKSAHVIQYLSVAPILSAPRIALALSKVSTYFVSRGRRLRCTYISLCLLFGCTISSATGSGCCCYRADVIGDRNRIGSEVASDGKGLDRLDSQFTGRFARFVGLPIWNCSVESVDSLYPLSDYYSTSSFLKALLSAVLSVEELHLYTISKYTFICTCINHQVCQISSSDQIFISSFVLSPLCAFRRNLTKTITPTITVATHSFSYPSIRFRIYIWATTLPYESIQFSQHIAMQTSLQILWAERARMLRYSKLKYRIWALSSLVYIE
jgi:hypothetical protein